MVTVGEARIDTAPKRERDRSLSEYTRLVELVCDRYSEDFGVQRTVDWYLLKLHEELGELTKAVLIETGRTRQVATDDQRDQTRNEIADVLAHVLLLARSLDIDPDQALATKWLPKLELETAYELP